VKPKSIWLLVAVAAGCTAAGRSSKGPPVAVYEADAKAPASDRRMPGGCRLLGAAGPVDQMESERMIDDPYKGQRREVARIGGNVLLVLSERLVTRPNLDCPSGDASADCVRRAQSWYRVRFEQYACSPEAVGELKALPPQSSGGGITIPLSSPKAAANPALTPAELKSRILDLMREKVAAEVILAYVKGRRLSRKMTAEEIIDWTKTGIPDAVIEAAASR
jgi:hypothetical protein